MISDDDSDENPRFCPQSGHAAELGLASLIIAAVLFVAAPITLILAVQVWRFADQGAAVVQLHAWLARAGVLIAMVISVGSVVFSWFGIRAANDSRQPKGLCLAGLFLSLAAFGLWIITAIGLLNVTESLLNLHGG